MKLHRLVIAFIVASGTAVLIAGLWFKTPSFPATAVKNAPAATAISPLSDPLTPLTTAAR